MPSSRDFYQILGVPRNASGDEIRSAFRNLAKRYHPDINKESNAEEQFKAINEAYGVLSDDQRRAAYDRFGEAGLTGMPAGSPMGFEDLGDLFEEFFRGFGMGTGRSRRSPHRGADLQTEVSLTFEESAFGVEKEVELTRQEVCSSCKGSRAEPGTTPVRCSTCNGSGEERRMRQTFLGSLVNVSTCSQCGGTGEVIRTPCKACRGEGLERKTRKLKVPIPPGVNDGMQIRLAGEGGPGQYGGPTGNLYLLVRVKKHEYFHRRKNDLWMELGVNFLQAALGADLRVPTLEGEASLRIPPGTQPGQIFRLRGKGMPRLQQSGRGDLLIIMNVQVPASLTAEQKKLLGQSGISSDAAPKPQAHTLLDSLREFIGE